MLADTLIVVGMSVVSLGTIHEADGVQARTFHLHNGGENAVSLVQGYTSCGCTTIDFAKAAMIQPGDTTQVTLSFNPRGKGGEFYESGTLVYNTPSTSNVRKRVQMVLEGTCVTSEETLMKQFPIRIVDGIRLSANRFDLGRMSRGEKKERNVVVLHQDEENRQERIPVTFIADEKVGKGLQHIVRTYSTKQGDKTITFHVTFDVIIL